MKLYMTAIFLSALVALVGGCASSSGMYEPPAAQSDGEKNYSRIVEKSFDDTWSALIRHAAGTFFAIDNFEKESGLLTLTFGTSDPSAFIDCGEWDGVWTNERFQTKTFSGTYVDYLIAYQGGSFSGKMNLLVTELGPEQSEITVNARYILLASPESWAFDSGGKATVYVSDPARGTDSSARTCQPTYKAETTILDAVKSLSVD